MINPFVYAFTMIFATAFAFVAAFALAMFGLSAFYGGNVFLAVICALLVLVVLSLYTGLLCKMVS